MPNLFRDFFGILNEEKERLDQLVNRRQGFAPLAPQSPLVVAAAAILGLGASSLLLQNVEKEQLSDHPLCGIPTGGQVSSFISLKKI